MFILYVFFMLALLFKGRGIKSWLKSAVLATEEHTESCIFAVQKFYYVRTKSRSKLVNNQYDQSSPTTC